MKTKLLFYKATAVVFLIASQVGLAQTGGSFAGATPPNIVNGTIIQFENFDIGGNADTNVGGTAPFGYRDTTSGNGVNTDSSWEKNDTYRAGTDVDLATHIKNLAPWDAYNGDITLNSNSANEFQYYTVTVGETSSDYYIRINYGHGSGTPKRFLIEKLDLNLENKVTLVDGTDRDSEDFTALPKTGSSWKLETNDAGPVNSGPTKFTLTAGETFVIKFSHKDGGPAFNWFQFVNDASTLNTEKFDLGAFSLLNPVNQELTIKGLPSNVNNISVYSLLGQKLLSREAKTESLSINVSSLKSGMYIVTFSGENGKFTRRIIKK
ncbi:T9SS type A sorting domain-containing protein [Polaribacter aquimarinus]|uniref:Secretion system C-terminal sorting domain-containing protein n=1 Tax=Polaribacter aquimarinus TaxID=2100726 RepID=A0A2U2JEH2_9FLAO|nr:T9SS type A sorting domain-containing protein [Polaribacter aquimarinus]PWG06736.1 hypothetical protein DIS07_02550 [Polaribacter aquimarinus]